MRSYELFSIILCFYADMSSRSICYATRRCFLDFRFQLTKLKLFEVKSQSDEVGYSLMHKTAKTKNPKKKIGVAECL